MQKVVKKVFQFENYKIEDLQKLVDSRNIVNDVNTPVIDFQFLTRRRPYASLPVMTLDVVFNEGQTFTYDSAGKLFDGGPLEFQFLYVLEKAEGNFNVQTKFSFEDFTMPEVEKLIEEGRLRTRNGDVCKKCFSTSGQTYPYSVDFSVGRRKYTSQGFYMSSGEGSPYDLVYMTDGATAEPEDKVEVGMWVKCTQTCIMELKEHCGKEAVTKGEYYQVRRFDSPAYFQLRSKVMERHPFDNTTGEGQYFDLENPQWVIPDSACFPAPDFTVRLEKGMWVRCLEDFTPIGRDITFISRNWYMITNDTGYALGVQFPDYGQFSLSKTSAASKFDLGNPQWATPVEPDTATEPTSILLEANELIYGERAAAYGPVTANFGRIAVRWSQIFGIDVTPEQVGLAMIDLKISRHLNSPKRDNLVDIAGYIGCLDKLSKGE